MNVGSRINALMESKKMTQKEFCQKTGLPQSTVSEWTRNDKCPSADKVLRICDALEVTPYELLQDTAGEKSGKINNLDYIIVSEGTDKYLLLEKYDRLSQDLKNRVMGYIQALLTD